MRTQVRATNSSDRIGSNSIVPNEEANSDPPLAGTSVKRDRDDFEEYFKTFPSDSDPPKSPLKRGTLRL
ncbi:MAG: hypothetical protein HC894_24580 [Microcoleus sp. SM1_3_4]|nr:hypothetical protein [Microcoleus sp. SM1_3_4]